jgi:acetyl-CoA carboxylase carboxyltransferase component
MCGRAFDPFLTLAWPSARCAVMGASQAANTLLQIRVAADRKRGVEDSEAEQREILRAIQASYDEQQDIRYGAARGWVDRIIEPQKTRDELATALQIASTFVIAPGGEFRTGVLQT